MANKSGVSEQIISMPKGGGALKGIGEKFAPDLFTGTGNFTVPIAVPPGRNGFQPQLNLVYSTGNGNGVFGLGWSLSVPGVSRKTSKGIPRYHDYDPQEKSDVFILSGADDDTSAGVRDRILGAVTGVRVDDLVALNAEIVPKLIDRVRPESMRLLAGVGLGLTMVIVASAVTAGSNGLEFVIFFAGAIATMVAFLLPLSLLRGGLGAETAAVVIAWTVAILASYAGTGVVATALAVIFRKLTAWREGKQLAPLQQS